MGRNCKWAPSKFSVSIDFRACAPYQEDALLRTSDVQASSLSLMFLYQPLTVRSQQSQQVIGFLEAKPASGKLCVACILHPVEGRRDDKEAPKVNCRVLYLPFPCPAAGDRGRDCGSFNISLFSFPFVSINCCNVRSS